MRNEDAQTLHDSWVKTIAYDLLGEGYITVFADLPGLAKPPNLGGHVPDVYAERQRIINGIPLGAEVLIVEVETEDTIETGATKLQHMMFSLWARAREAAFRVVVAR